MAIRDARDKQQIISLLEGSWTYAEISTHGTNRVILSLRSNPQLSVNEGGYMPWQKHLPVICHRTSLRKRCFRRMAVISAADAIFNSRPRRQCPFLHDSRLLRNSMAIHGLPLRLCSLIIIRSLYLHTGYGNTQKHTAPYVSCRLLVLFAKWNRIWRLTSWFRKHFPSHNRSYWTRRTYN